MKTNVMNKINKRMVVIAVGVLAIAAALFCAQSAIAADSPSKPGATDPTTGLSLTIGNHDGDVKNLTVSTTSTKASNCTETPAANFEVRGDGLATCTWADVTLQCENATKVAGKTGKVYIQHSEGSNVAQEAVDVTFNASGACSFRSQGLSIFSVVVSLDGGSTGTNGNLTSPQTGIF